MCATDGGALRRKSARCCRHSLRAQRSYRRRDGTSIIVLLQPANLHCATLCGYSDFIQGRLLLLLLLLLDLHLLLLDLHLLLLLYLNLLLRCLNLLLLLLWQPFCCTLMIQLAHQQIRCSLSPPPTTAATNASLAPTAGPPPSSPAASTSSSTTTTASSSTTTTSITTSSSSTAAGIAHLLLWQHSLRTAPRSKGCLQMLGPATAAENGMNHHIHIHDRYAQTPG